jgi:hypothetical protein
VGTAVAAIDDVDLALDLLAGAAAARLWPGALGGACFELVLPRAQTG